MNVETTKTPGSRQDKFAWLTPAEAVEESGIGRTRLYGFLTSGALPSAKVGRTRHIRRQDLDRFLEERMTRTPAAPRSSPAVEENERDRFTTKVPEDLDVDTEKFRRPCP